MKVNGSLVFDASSASTIQNLRLEKVATLPSAGAADVGRLIYNTATNVIYVGVDAGGYTWTPLATGGDASALLSEVDRIETALGLNADGSFNAAAFTGNLAAQTSYVGLITTLQGLIATNASGLAAEITRATGREDAIEDALEAEVTRATGAEGTLTTNLAAEVTRATTREDAIEDALEAEVTRATGAETTLTNNLSAEVARATGRENAIEADLDQEIADRIAADTVLQTAITAEATTARAAELALRNDLTAEITRATDADTAHTTAISAEVTRATAAEGVLTDDLAAEVARATAAEQAITADMDARLQGLSWKNPVRVATTGNVDLEAAAAGFDGVTLTAGDRVLVKAQTNAFENGIYVFNGAGVAMTRAADMNIAGEFFSATVYVREGDTQADLGFTQTGEVATIGTDAVTFVQFAGAGSVTAGAGLTQNGNVIQVVSADSSITVTADAIQVSAALQTAVSDNTAAIAQEVTDRQAADTALDTAIQTAVTDAAAALATEIADRIADVNVEEARAIAAEAALGQRITDEVNRASAAEGEVAGDLAQEILDRTNADSALATDISDEEARAITREDAIEDALEAEVLRATGVENGLDLRLDLAESRISNLYSLYDGFTPATSHTVQHNLGQKYCNVTVVDENDEMVIPQSVTFVSDTQLVVTFNTAIACKVVVMGLAALQPLG